MTLFDTLRWVLPPLVPVALAVLLVARSDLRHAQRVRATGTFVLGGVAGGVTAYVTALGSRWTGLEVRSSVAGEGAALLFMFCLVAPLGEVSKVAAVWPAFLSHHFEGRREGVAYAALAALGFGAVEVAVMLYGHSGRVWLARAALTLPADVFFATFWGYALGRAKRASRRATSIFPVAWVVATASHGLYNHIAFGRGSGALVGVVPLLLAMAGVAWVGGREIWHPERKARALVDPDVDPADRLSRLPFLALAEPPTLEAVRDALRGSDQPVKLRWILLGALVTVGAMVAGLSAAIAFGYWMHIDFSVVDEHDAATTAPLALLGVGLLVAFPISGFLVARASNVPTLLEPAIASALAILAVCVALGLMAPIALVFAFAFSPIAFGLSCAGAWAGLPTA